MLDLVMISADVRVTARPGTEVPGENCGCATRYYGVVPQNVGVVRVLAYAADSSHNINVRVNGANLGSRRDDIYRSRGLKDGRNELILTVWNRGQTQAEIHRFVIYKAGPPPTLTGVYTYDGDVLLQYDRPLMPDGPQSAGAPDILAFEVVSDGTRVSLNSVDVGYAIVTLSPGLDIDPSVETRVSYTVPDTNPIRSSREGMAAGFTNRPARPYHATIWISDVTVMEGEDETAPRMSPRARAPYGALGLLRPVRGETDARLQTTLRRNVQAR